MMDTIIQLGVITIAVLILFALRTHVVFRARTTAINEIYRRRIAAINSHQEPDIDYDILGSFDRQTLMFHKWTFKQFYPQLA